MKSSTGRTVAESVKLVGTSAMKATIPIISKGAVSPKACAIARIEPVMMPGMANGRTWWKIACIFDAPTPSAASRIDGGTAFKAAREAIIITGKLIKVSTIPPTIGAERGMLKKVKKTAKPKSPNTMEGTAARLLILTSIKSVSAFLGANYSK
jgi:hypothetical protein